MFDGLIITQIVPVSLGLLFTLRACWYWHELSETLNSADIAGLSDGRCILSLLAGLKMERKRLWAKSIYSASFAGVIAILAIMRCYYFD